MTIDGATITDSHPHGDLTVEQVVQKSSNIGTAKLALQFQPKEMWELYTAVGMGQKPQIGFPGVVTGRLRPYKSWRRIEQVTMSYGYGLSASLFQLAQAYTVFASDGELIPITLLKREGLSDDAPRKMAGSDAEERPVLAFKTAFRTGGSGISGAHDADDEVVPVRGTRVISPETAQAVRKMLRMAAEPGGTAPMARTQGYSVGGKSGTAHKQEGKGYAGNKYRSWFVGIAPISKPRIVVAVMVDEPSNGAYYGGAVAGPVFSQVVQQTLHRLGVLPDMEVQPNIMPSEPAELESF